MLMFVGFSKTNGGASSARNLGYQEVNMKEVIRFFDAASVLYSGWI